MQYSSITLSLVVCFATLASAQPGETPTIEQMIERYRANPQIDWSFVDSKPKHQPEAILNLLAERGGSALQPLRDLRNTGKTSSDSDAGWSLTNDLALLTTIRRIEGKAAPLRIDVNEGQRIKSAVRETPRIPVKIVNQDPGQESVWFTFGGDYRSGRLSRWRIHVWDENGERLPTIGQRAGMGGGVYTQGELEFGESDHRALDLAGFVRIRRPGLYTAKVFYHDSVSIADIDNEEVLAELVLVASDKCEIEVKPGPTIRITLSEDDYEKANVLISQLMPPSTIKMIGSEYGPRYHSFISPDSPHGKLLIMGYAAVPALIEQLKQPDAGYKQRALILAILDSILHERYLTPMDFDGAIDNYHCRFPGGHYSGKVAPSKEVQDQLVEQWLSFSDDYIMIDKQN